MPLPVDKILCPSLLCTVNDNIFKGQFQPLIGNFMIHLGEILFDRNDLIQKRIDDLGEIAE